MIRKSFVKINENKKSENVFEDEQFEEIDEKECKIEDQNLISIEHHIVYSISYTVPVLYFKSCYLSMFI